MRHPLLESVVRVQALELLHDPDDLLELIVTEDVISGRRLEIKECHVCRWQLSALFLARPQAEKAGQDNDLSEAKSTWRSSQQLVVAAPFSKFLAARDLTSSAREKRLRLRLCRLRSCPLRSRRAPLLRNPEKFSDDHVLGQFGVVLEHLVIPQEAARYMA